jgi:hypothetical protein
VDNHQREGIKTMAMRISRLPALPALFLALVLPLMGCGRTEQQPAGEQKKPTDTGQYLAIVVILPVDGFTDDQRLEKQLALESLVEAKKVGRVVRAGIKRNIIEVVFEVTMEGDARGRLRRVLLDWDPSLSYAIEERPPVK